MERGNIIANVPHFGEERQVGSHGSCPTAKIFPLLQVGMHILPARGHLQQGNAQGLGVFGGHGLKYSMVGRRLQAVG